MGNAYAHAIQLHAKFVSVVPESGREGRDVGCSRLGDGQQSVFQPAPATKVVRHG